MAPRSPLEPLPQRADRSVLTLKDVLAILVFCCVNMGALCGMYYGIKSDIKDEAFARASDHADVIQKIAVVDGKADQSITLLKDHGKKIDVIEDRHLVVGPTLIHIDEFQLAWQQFAQHNRAAWVPDVDDTHRILHPTPQPQ